MKLGQLLKELRGDESLRDAAKRINISHVYLAMLEKEIDRRTGKPLQPTPETLKKIAQGYKCDYTRLMTAAGIVEEVIPSPGEPFPDNPILQNWYKQLPNCREEDVVKLMAMWQLIQTKDGGTNALQTNQ